MRRTTKTHFSFPFADMSPAFSQIFICIHLKSALAESRFKTFHNHFIFLFISIQFNRLKQFYFTLLLSHRKQIASMLEMSQILLFCNLFSINATSTMRSHNCWCFYRISLWMTHFSGEYPLEYPFWTKLL